VKFAIRSLLPALAAALVLACDGEFLGPKHLAVARTLASPTAANDATPTTVPLELSPANASVSGRPVIGRNTRQ
jgi:hypothetical protein